MSNSWNTLSCYTLLSCSVSIWQTNSFKTKTKTKIRENRLLTWKGQTNMIINAQLLTSVRGNCKSGALTERLNGLAWHSWHTSTTFHIPAFHLSFSLCQSLQAPCFEFALQKRLKKYTWTVKTGNVLYKTTCCYILQTKTENARRIK